MAFWDRITSRGRVIDRRSAIPVIGGISLTAVIALMLFNYLAGGNPADVLNQLQTVPIDTQREDASKFQGADSYEVFASTVLGSNNDMWKEVLNGANRNYTEPALVLFRTATESACGTATSEVGPHYCPLDATIYLDETFFDEIKNILGAKGGDVAEAYVISHEVGHHAQKELGIMDKINSLASENPERANELSIRMELQADCFAGLWANSIKDTGVLEPGEIQEAMDAAASVGDDRVQEKVTGQINPETWTHGSSEQRVEWFTRGYNSGSLSECNTF